MDKNERTARARKAALALNAKLTPDERRASSRRAYLAGAANTIVARVDELTDEQAARIAQALASLR